MADEVDFAVRGPSAGDPVREPKRQLFAPTFNNLSQKQRMVNVLMGMLFHLLAIGLLCALAQLAVRLCSYEIASCIRSTSFCNMNKMAEANIVARVLSITGVTGRPCNAFQPR